MTGGGGGGQPWCRADCIRSHAYPRVLRMCHVDYTLRTYVFMCELQNASKAMRMALQHIHVCITEY